LKSLLKPFEALTDPLETLLNSLLSSLCSWRRWAASCSRELNRSLNGPFGNLTELPIELPVQLEALGGKLQQGFAASQDSLLVEVQSTLAQMGRETKQTTDHELKASLTALKLALQEELGSVRREMAQQVNILFNCSYCEYPLPVSHSKAVVLLTKSRIVAGDARRTRDAREGTGGAGGGAQAADEGAGGAADGTGHTAYGVEV
jgi:hypothetical protein